MQLAFHPALAGFLSAAGQTAASRGLSFAYLMEDERAGSFLEKPLLDFPAKAGIHTHIVASFVVPASNFGSSGVLPVGSKQDMSPWGSYDMAGNVKEWVWNEAGSGKRYVLGGAWDEPNYMFIDPDAQSAFLRASNIGFRCVKYIEPDLILKVVTDPITISRRNLTKEKPASDEVFKAYRGLYSYDKLPLSAGVEPFGTDEEDWKAEKITYKAAYGDERAIAYLFLPKKAKSPFQTVIVFPG